MLPASLDEPFVKMDRAMAQVYSLNAQINEFRSFMYSNRHPTRLERNPQTGEYLVKLNPLGDPPLEWSAWVGEIVHDIRSALDHTVWQFANATQGEPDPLIPLPKWRESLQFPIFWRPPFPKSDKEFVNRVRNGVLCHVHPAAIERIRNVQPYVVAPNDPASVPLAALARLSNIDKHQTLHILTHYITPTDAPIVTIEAFDCTINDRWDRGAGSVEPDEVLATFSVVTTGPNPQVHIKPNITPNVAFGEQAPVGGRPVLEALVNLWMAVNGFLLSLQDMLPPLLEPRRQPKAFLFDARLMMWPEPEPDFVE